jgi:4a-hydroxytetrahydrobiopterin dehydratase
MQVASSAAPGTAPIVARRSRIGLGPMSSELPAHCQPCRPGAPALSEAEARRLLAHAPGWTLDFPRLARREVLRDFRAAMDWIASVGELAESEGHHPDIHLTGWNQVELVLWTHAIGGLSLNDFVLARRIAEAATGRTESGRR